MGLLSSRSSSSVINATHDGRVIAEGQGVGISAQDGGQVDVQFVPDEAFALASGALNRSFDYLQSAQEAQRTEGAQIADQFMKVAIPALVVAVVAWRVWK